MSKKYVALYERLLGEIQTGAYSAGAKLPTEQQIAKAHNISRQTVRQSLKMLEDEGFIRRTQGSGSYVTDKLFMSKRCMRVIVITSYIGDYIFPSILRGIEEVTSAKRYEMVLYATRNSIAREREILESLSPDTFDGIIVEGTRTALPNPNLPFYHALREKGIPLVFFNGYYQALFEKVYSKTVYVVADDYRGAYELTRTLVAEGHREIGGIFKGDDIQGLHRFSGYIDALAHNGAGMADESVLWFNTETKFSIERMLEESKLLERCTALVCYNDEIAQQVLAALRTRRGSVSSIRSFDGTLTQHGEYDFRSLRHPKEALGRIAAEKLLNLIDNVHEESVVLSWEN